MHHRTPVGSLPFFSLAHTTGRLTLQTSENLFLPSAVSEGPVLVAVIESLNYLSWTGPLKII